MKIIKRDGRIVDYDRQKIAVAIEKANRDVKGKEKAKTSEELYREYAQSGMTLNDFALSVGISRTTLWRKFKNINSENKNETRNN